MEQLDSTLYRRCSRRPDNSLEPTKANFLSRHMREFDTLVDPTIGWQLAKHVGREQMQ